jgi:hypothetical protein
MRWDEQARRSSPALSEVAQPAGFGRCPAGEPAREGGAGRHCPGFAKGGGHARCHWPALFSVKGRVFPTADGNDGQQAAAVDRALRCNLHLQPTRWREARALTA